VWCAWLNLEERYGTERTLMDVFKRACVLNDPKVMHLRLLDILEESPGDRAALCEAVYRAACKKWPASKKMHIRRARFKFRRGWAAGARKGLAEALRLLPKRKHLATLSAFAQLEFGHGEPERGRSVFESVVGEYPKRLDLLRVYIDQEVKLVRNGKSDPRVARHLITRSLGLDVAPRKAKAMFKLALAFEKEFGTDRTIDEVKRLAREFVESTARGR
jgi:rRNA biogenesis protein RRP5